MMDTSETRTHMLPRRPLGKTGILVPPIATGCAPLGNMPETFEYGVDEERALATVRAALNSELNYLDTAAWYGDGESERRVGLVLREFGGLPKNAMLQTKEGNGPGTPYTGEVVKRRFERSLSLLGVNYVPVVYLHNAEHCPFEEAVAPGGPMDVLRSYQEQGVIGHLGVAPGPIAASTRYVESGAFEVLITHNRYTLLNRIADPLIDLAVERGLAVLNAAPYGSGLLAKGPGAYPRYAYRAAPPEYVARAARMAAICERHGVPLAAAALQFSLRDPRITATIVGMSRPKRIAETISLATTPIPDECWSELAQVPYDTTTEPE